jgi:hypothetical protein
VIRLLANLNVAFAVAGAKEPEQFELHCGCKVAMED